MSGSERDSLHAAADKAGLTLAAFVRSLSLDGAGVEPFLTDQDREVFAVMQEDMRAIGVNVNQMARAINSGRIPHHDEVLITLRNVGLIQTALMQEIQKLTARAGNRPRRKVS